MDENNYVVKHNKLIESKGRMTLLEQKILRTVISELQPSDEDFQEYIIEVSELQALLGWKRNDLYEDLKHICNRLMDRKIEIEDITSQGKRQWFVTRYLSSAKYVDGEGYLKVKFDPDLKPYLLELKEQFTQYQLKYVMQMKSTHSVRLYELLKQYETIGKRTFNLQIFKQYLGIENDYDRLFDLEKRVLKTSMEEINDQTDIYVEYKKIKKGRSVDSIEYTIWPKDCYKPKYDVEYIENIVFYSGLKKFKFSDKQVAELYEIACLKTIGTDVSPYEYIRYNVVSMNQKSQARNKFAYLKESLENDYAHAIAQINQNYDLIGAGPAPKK